MLPSTTATINRYLYITALFFFLSLAKKKKKHATRADETMMANIKGVNKYRPEKELLLNSIFDSIVSPLIYLYS